MADEVVHPAKHESIKVVKKVPFTQHSGVGNLSSVVVRVRFCRLRPRPETSAVLCEHQSADALQVSSVDLPGPDRPEETTASHFQHQLHFWACGTAGRPPQCALFVDGALAHLFFESNVIMAAPPNVQRTLTLW